MNNRRAIASKVLRELYVKSGNRCAKCQIPLYTEDGFWIGEIAHIEAVRPGGTRYNPMLTPEQINSFDNLILVCRNCHKEIDSDANLYTTNCLKNMKYKAEYLLETILQSSSFTDYDRKFVKKMKPVLINIINIIIYLDIHGGFNTSIIENIDVFLMSFEEEYYNLSGNLHDTLSGICQCMDELEKIIMENTKPHPSNVYIACGNNHISEHIETMVFYLRNKLVHDIDVLLKNGAFD